MITKFVDNFMKGKGELRKVFEKAHPKEYVDIVEAVIEVISDGDCSDPDPATIQAIKNGDDYQGSTLFVINDDMCTVEKYWCVAISYGSCSTCDIIERIREFPDDKPNVQQVDDYITLCLHIVQNIKELNVINGFGEE